MTSTRHLCALCGNPTQTGHNGACIDCKQRISEQIHRYADLAGLFILEMNALFDVYEIGTKRIGEGKCTAIGSYITNMDSPQQ